MPTATESGEGPLGTAIAFSHALLGRDTTAALAYFGAGARMLTADGTEVSGPDAIRAVLLQLTSPSQKLEIRPGRTLVAGSVALCSQSWRLLSAGSTLPSYERASKATLVLQRRDRRWQILIAAPWG